MTYIVHGATGAQGSPVISKLTAAGAQAAGLSRNDVALPDATTIVADLSSAESLKRAYENAEGVFIHLPAGPDEAVRSAAQNVLSALKATTPARVVISTSGAPLTTPQGQESSIGALIAGVESAGLSHAVIDPRLYFENLLMPPLVQGVLSEGVLRYPIREDMPISWASHLDIADAVAALLLDRRDVTGTIGLGQSPGITAQDLAAGYSEHFGREIAFESVLPADFGKNIATVVGEAAATSVVGLYQSLWEAPAHVIDEDSSAQLKLGLTPRTTSEWLSAMGL